MVVFGSGKDTQQRIYILTIDDGVHETGFKVRFCGLHAHETICQSVELRYVHMTGSSYSRFILIPDAANILHRLHSVSVGHRSAEEWLYRRFEGTDFEDLHLYTDFLQYARVVHLLCRKTFPIHRTGRIKTDAVSDGSYIVVGLTIVLRRSENPFAALLEIEECVTDRFGVRRSHTELCSIEPDTQDLVIILRQTDVRENLIETDRLPFVITSERYFGHCAHEFSEGACILCLLDQFALHLKTIDGLVLQFDGGGREHVSHQPA